MPTPDQYAPEKPERLLGSVMSFAAGGPSSHAAQCERDPRQSESYRTPVYRRHSRQKQMDHAMNVGMLWNILRGKPVFMGDIAISRPILTHQRSLMFRQSRVAGLKGHAVRARDQQRRRVMWGAEQVAQAGFGCLLA